VTFPVLIRLGSLTVQPHWLFETLAYTLAGYVYARDRRRQGDVVSKRTRWWVIGAAAVGGFAGSRALALLEDPLELQRHWSEPAFLASGKTIVGGGHMRSNHGMPFPEQGEHLHQLRISGDRVRREDGRRTER